MAKISVIFALQGEWLLVALVFVLALIGSWLIGRIEHSQKMHDVEAAKCTLPLPMESNPAKIARIKAELSELKHHQ